VNVRADLVRMASPGRTRLDLDATLPWRRGIVRVGLNDFTEANRFNLQLGQLFGPGRTLRYGIHASELGLGVDLGPVLRPWLETDLYSLQDPRLDLRTSYGLQRQLDLTLGVDDLFGSNVAVGGVRWRF
jgi:hypothetical protein